VRFETGIPFFGSMRYAVVFFCLLSFLRLQAQVDSLNGLLTTAKGDERLPLLVELFEVTKFGNSDSAKLIADEGIRISRQLGRDSSIQNFLYLKAVAVSIQGLWIESDSLALESMQICKATGNEEGVVTAYSLLAINAHGRQDEDSAIACNQRVLEILEDMDLPKRKALTHMNLGNSFLTVGNYPSSLKEYLLAEEGLKELKDIRNVTLVKTNISLVLRRLELYPQALEEALKAKQYIVENNPLDSIHLLYWVHNSLGSIYRSIGRSEDAIKSNQIAIRLSIKTNRKLKEAGNRNNLANNYADLEMYDKALLEYRKALSIRKVRKRPSSVLYRSMAVVFIKIGQLDSAQQYVALSQDVALDQGLVSSQLANTNILAEMDLLRGQFDQCIARLKETTRDSLEFTSPQIFRKGLELKAQAYQALGNYQKAYAVKTKLHEFTENTVAEFNKISVSQIEALELLNNWEERLKRKDLEVERLQFEQIEDKRKLRSYVVWAALLTIILALLIYFRWKTIKGRAILLSTENELLQTQTLLTEQQLIASKEAKQRLEEKVSMMAETISEKNAFTEKVMQELDRLKTVNTRDNAETLDQLRDFLAANQSGDRDWEAFFIYFDQLYPGFHNGLNRTYPELTPSEIRFCILLRINLSTKEIAYTLGISPMSANSARYRIRKKLQLQPSEKLEDVLQQVNTESSL